MMNATTGEVCYGFAPRFNPNARLSGWRPSRNVMAQDAHELGSVFKVFVYACDGGPHHPVGRVFPIAAGFRIGGITIHDAEKLPP